MLRVIRSLIHTQDLLHAVDKLRTLLRGDDPLFDTPGLDFIFFSTVATLVEEIWSTMPNSTTLSAINCNFQRLCPAGGSLQQIARIWASTLPSIFLSLRVWRG